MTFLRLDVFKCLSIKVAVQKVDLVADISGTDRMSPYKFKNFKVRLMVC
jgi:hypothetical protein